MNLDVAKLPDDAAELKRVIADLQQFYTQELEELQARYDKEVALLIDQLRLLRAQLYDRRSEKTPPEYQDTTLLSSTCQSLKRSLKKR